ncbi:electron transfer flavoprotein beta subunit lysine methyltransferase-like [Topomyia yanbarensis]|uniref:electron transfer flavoprotein beta subunit lysine methyltransferase-like n=1 Tax=Topomyia yanbarensis TaxID=2498891 RepID=UPI00273C8B6E|nr:electron transfer flavoprotein beta subunit lysine methyltransferase-like [Topomyia yanbarensis]XP_058831621.1 electron transfer flavoprotein beta subunit lysine methyltransferase-like [Topomyia yanbarensis]XP_058831622.1 electron transfer flavoprotein beta subunit lysine methyltransferase-like [Topomyia yanbarensis]XP_058831623.1 electron transfer flavoprotein beta subunit lysine methyltransferase-like [Topomyia yanbarensis]
MFRKVAHLHHHLIHQPVAAAAVATGAVVNRQQLFRRRRPTSIYHAIRYHKTGTGGGGIATITNNKNMAKSPHPATLPADDRVSYAERSEIWRNTRISRHHMAPEIALHLITEECAIYHQPIRDDFCFATEPFWGFFWPGGQALTRFILDNERLFSGKQVLDVGSGCGASAIAARLVRAKRVTANDIDPTALQAALLNAELNSVDLEISDRNMIGQPCDDFDVVMIGDLFYDAEIADVLQPWLIELAASGVDIYIGDPGRHGLTEARLRNMIELACYQLPANVCIENNGFSHASVWKFVPSGNT